MRGRCVNPGENWLNHGYPGQSSESNFGAALYELLAEQVLGTSDLVELGCGYGSGVCLLARRLGARVTGVDICLCHVRYARSLPRSKNVIYRWDDSAALGAPSGSVDAVLAVESIHGVNDRAAVVREAARLLRRGGRFVVADIERTDGPRLDEIVRSSGYRVLESYSISGHVALALARRIEAIDRGDVGTFKGEIAMQLAQAVDRPRFELLAFAYAKRRLDYRVLVASME